MIKINEYNFISHAKPLAIPILLLVAISILQFLQLKSLVFALMFAMTYVVIFALYYGTRQALVIFTLFLLALWSNQPNLLEARAYLKTHVQFELFEEPFIVSGKVVSELASKNPLERELKIRLIDKKALQGTLIQVQILDLPWSQENEIDLGDFVQCSLNSYSLSKNESFADLYRAGVSAKFRISAKDKKLFFCKPLAASGITKKTKQLFDMISSSNRRALSVILAATIGQEQHLENLVREKFKETGLYHLLVVSGYHLALIFSISKKWMNKLVSKNPFILFHFTTTKLSTILATAISGLFISISSMGMPILRAGLMASLFSFCLQLDRKSNIVEGICWSLVLLIVLIPFAILHIGVQLSYSALIGVTVGAKISNKLQNTLKTRCEGVRPLFLSTLSLVLETIIVSTSAFIFLYPVQLFWFGPPSLNSLMQNILLGHIFTICAVLFGGLNLMVFYVSEPLGNILLSINSICLEIILRIMELLKYKD